MRKAMVNPDSSRPKHARSNNTYEKRMRRVGQTSLRSHYQSEPLEYGLSQPGPASLRYRHVRSKYEENDLPDSSKLSDWQEYSSKVSNGPLAKGGQEIIAPRVTVTQWDDENTLCYQVEARGITVARREDNHMINGTRLLSVSIMTRVRRDEILKAEKTQHIIESGPMDLNGVWIPFERALDLANHENIADLLHPLFVHNIGALLHQATSQGITYHNRKGANLWKELPDIGAESSCRPDLEADTPLISKNDQSTKNDLNDSKASRSIFPITEHLPDPESSGGSERRTTPAILMQRYGMNLGQRPRVAGYEPADGYWEHSDKIGSLETKATEARPVIITTFVDEDKHSTPGKRKHDNPLSSLVLPSRADEQKMAQDEPGAALSGSKSVGATAAGLSPSQESPQSDSESSSGSSPGPFTREEWKDFLLDRLMSYFFERFASCHSPVPSTVTTAGSGVAHTTETRGNLDGHQNTNAGASKSNNASDHGNRASLKRRIGEDDDNDEQSGDRRQPGKHARVEGSKRAAGRRLACPYFQKDPEYPQLARSCSGPGWETVHRLKEHLDRNHALPPSCDRCYTAFKTDADRTAHLRSEIQCELREPPGPMHGFNASQKDQLKMKSRSRDYKAMSEIQKWCHVYTILFPETDEADIPSPYYNYASFHDHGRPIDRVDEYVDFMRREMPNRIMHYDQIRIENAMDPTEERLRNQLLEAFGEALDELSQIYRTSMGATIQDNHSHPEPVDNEANAEVDDNEDNGNRDSTPRDAAGLTNSLDLEQSRSENVLEVYPPGPIPEDFWRDFDWKSLDLSSLEDLSGTHALAHEILPMSLEEADNDSILTRETSFV